MFDPLNKEIYQRIARVAKLSISYRRKSLAWWTSNNALYFLAFKVSAIYFFENLFKT